MVIEKVILNTPTFVPYLLLKTHIFQKYIPFKALQSNGRLANYYLGNNQDNLRMTRY